MFLKYVRAAREVLAMQPLSADAEGAYCDALAPMEDAQAVAALRLWMRRADRFPMPHEIRDVAAQMKRQMAGSTAKEPAHG